MSTRRADLRAQGLERLRAGAREQADFQDQERIVAHLQAHGRTDSFDAGMALGIDPERAQGLCAGLAEDGRISEQTPEERPGHTGEVPFPAGDYPQSYAELTLRVESLEKLVQGLCAVERGRWESVRGMAPKPGDAVWRAVAGEEPNAGVNT